MKRHLTLAAAIAAFATPLAAHAQVAETIVDLEGIVGQACVIGSPTTVNLNLGDLTGTDGRIAAALTGSSTIAGTTIDTAWCNGPGTLSLAATPLALTPAPSYATPNGFARFVTYNADLTGWTSALQVRPSDDSNPADNSAANAAAYANPLTLGISSLATLNATGSAANSGQILEAGAYTASVTVSIAVN